MAWSCSDSLAEYSAAVSRVLRGSPARNTILLGAAETLGSAALRRSAAQTRCSAGGQSPAGGHRRLPAHPAVSARADQHAGPARPLLAQALAGRGRAVPGVNGGAPAAAAFAAAWQRLTGDTATKSMASRLYRLGRLRPPQPPPPGQARVAGPGDRGRLLAWNEAFHDEAHAGGRGRVAHGR